MSTRPMPANHASLQVVGEITPEFATLLTDEALTFVAELVEHFGPRRDALLARRAERQQQLNAGMMPDFLAETAKIRQQDWQVASTPADLQDRRVEITGPVDRKMVINALNSGAKVFMADFEDAQSPTWTGLINGQMNLRDAINRQIDYTSPEGKSYRLNATIATLVVRPRGWHLPEKHVLFADRPIAGAFLDFGLYCF
ncbi:MAG: malate synthase A, partial [Pseudomonadota bacterium]|nr:malate synthase A [Pseudomonadota bacterium]